MQPYIMGGYRRHWGTEPYANQWGVNAYRPPFASALQGTVRLRGGDEDTTAPNEPLGNAVLHIVAGALVGGAIAAASSSPTKRLEKGIYGAGMTAGSVAVIDAFIVGRESVSTGISLGLLGVVAVATSFYAASKGY